MSQGHPTPDPFDTLALPPRFDLTAAQIRTAFLRKIAAAHPDAVGPDAAHDPDTLDASAAFADARRVLDDPEQRAAALLARLGGPSKEQDRSLPAGFLAEMMETREEIETAVRAKDAAACEHWRTWAKRQREEHMNRAANAFAALPQPPIPPALLANIRTQLNAWRYIERLLEQIDPAPHSS
jgi:molecular chaperone HscB